MAFLFDIKRYSINDGPGIRVTVFFKGCSMACKWCHNPESQSFKSEKLYTKNKCIGCGTCIDHCPENALSFDKTRGIITDFQKCILCGKCAAVCPTKAVEISGKNYSEDEVMSIIQRETSMMDFSDGGVTFSGGEPLMYPEVLKKLLHCCGTEDIHRAVDTCGNVKTSVLEGILPHTDLFLYDLKLMDSKKHKYWTGVENELILKNLQLIAAKNKPYHIRIPLINGVNSDDENIEETISFLKTLKKEPEVIALLPYHNIAATKYEKLGKIYDENGMSEPSKERLNLILEIFKQNGFNAKIGG